MIGLATWSYVDMIFLCVLSLGGLIGFLVSQYVQGKLESARYYDYPEDIPFDVSSWQAISDRIIDAPIMVVFTLLAIIGLQWGIICIMHVSTVRFSLFGLYHSRSD